MNSVYWASSIGYMNAACMRQILSVEVMMHETITSGDNTRENGLWEWSAKITAVLPLWGVNRGNNLVLLDIKLSNILGSLNNYRGLLILFLRIKVVAEVYNTHDLLPRRIWSWKSGETTLFRCEKAMIPEHTGVVPRPIVKKWKWGTKVRSMLNSSGKLRMGGSTFPFCSK